MIATDVALPFVFAYQQKLGRITENPAAMTEGIRSLFADKLHKDFMLRVQFDKIFVHKVILVARSPFFAAALAVKKSLKELEMKDIKLEVLRAVVFYMYTDEVPSLTDLTYELINAAKTFQMVDLYNKCMNQVLEIVSVDNALELRLIAEEYNCVELKKVLNHFITE